MNVGSLNVHESQQDSETRKLRIQDRRWKLQEREVSPRALRRTEIRNRRRRYLEEHPEYFRLPSHELADPLAYDRLVRRFQTAAERESDGRKKGYSGILEADLLRADAKAQAIASSRSALGVSVSYYDVDSVPVGKERGLAIFKEIIESRFLAGNDDDFDYSTIDQNSAYNDRGMERDREEYWFDDEEPTKIDDDSNLNGQTGVQDF